MTLSLSQIILVPGVSDCFASFLGAFLKNMFQEKVVLLYFPFYSVTLLGGEQAWMPTFYPKSFAMDSV